MKFKNFIPGMFIVMVITISSCTSLIECDHTTKRNELFLIDVTDEKLFNAIENDLNKNFPGFMQRTGLGNITPCQSLKLSFAHLSAKDELSMASASIAITRKGLSKKEEQKRANPTPLVQMMQKKINEYRQLSKDSSMTTGSNIANVLLKAINQVDDAEETDIFLFSDMVENNKQLNLYKAIPPAKDIPAVTKQIIETSVLEKFRQRQKEGLMIKIVVVMKPESGGKIKQRSIKEFWTSVFNELKLDVQFIDNLSNSVQL